MNGHQLVAKFPLVNNFRNVFTSLFVKCLIGIFTISCVGTFAVFTVWGLAERARLRAEMNPANFAHYFETNLNMDIEKLKSFAIDQAEVRDYLESMVPKIIHHQAALTDRYNCNLFYNQKLSLLVKFREPGQSPVQYPKVADGDLERYLADLDPDATPGQVKSLWMDLPGDNMVSAVSLVLPDLGPGTRFDFALKLDNQLLGLVFPQLSTLSDTVLYLFIVSFFSSGLLAFFIVRRIRKAEMVAVGWSTGNLTVKINDHKNDEFGRLTKTFDQMADSISKVIDIKQSLAAAEERNRLARDLHDTAKQRCFALGLQLSVLAHSLSDLPEYRDKVQAALNTTMRLQGDLSDVIQRFWGTTIAQSGLRQAICDSLDQLFLGSDISWKLELSPDEVKSLEKVPQKAVQLLLITNEVAANTLRHSAASHLKIVFQKNGAMGEWIISDNGCGFNPHDINIDGMGLDNLRYRARNLLGGNLTIDSQNGCGTTVSVSFGLEKECA